MSESGGGTPKHSHGDKQETHKDNSSQMLPQPAGHADQQHVGAADSSGPPTTGGGVSHSDEAVDGENQQEIVECPVPGCTVKYQFGAMNLRSKVCSAHQRMDNFSIDGVDHRYCHQCYKIHPLTQFTGNKRSCTQRLERHNLRRRLNRLYKKSFSKDAGAVGSSSSSQQPDHKAAVDLALQIMNATHPDEAAPGSITQAAGSSSRAAAGNAPVEPGGVGLPSAAVMASAAAAVRNAPDADNSSSSARDQEDANVGAAGLKAEEDYDYMGSGGSAATEASRRAAAGSGQQMSPAYGSRQSRCEMCGGVGCPSCAGGMPSGDQRPRSSLRPPSQGVASGGPAEATNIDSFLTQYDRYYDADTETRMAAEEAEGLLRGQSSRGYASGQVLMSTENYSQQQQQQQQQQHGRGGMNEMSGQPDPGMGAVRRSQAVMAAGPCSACGGFGCQLCSQDRYAQPSRNIRSEGGFPQDPRAAGRITPLMEAGGNRGTGRQAATEASGRMDWQQGMGPPSSGQGQFQQPLMRTPRGHPVYNISIKLFGDVTLAMLPPGLREEVQSWLNTAPLHADNFLRDGCVHLSMDFTLSTDEDYASAIKSVPGGFMSSMHSGNWPWCTCPATVWLPDRVIHAEQGQIVSDAPLDESNNSLELISAELVANKSSESNKACRLITLHGNDLKLPGLKVLLRSPADGRWEQLIACHVQGTVDASLPASASLSSSPDECTCTPEGSGSGESYDTRFPEFRGNQAFLFLEVPDSIQGGPAYVELVVDGDIGSRRQSRPIAVLLPPSSTIANREVNMTDS